MANADGLRAKVDERANEIHTAAVQTIIDAVREDAPRASGLLEQSVGEVARVASPGRLESTIAAPVEHASYQDRGTGIWGPTGQPIRPVNGRVLAWEGTVTAQGFTFPGAGKTASGMIFATEVAGVPPTGFWSDNVTIEAWSAALGEQTT